MGNWILFLIVLSYFGTLSSAQRLRLEQVSRGLKWRNSNNTLRWGRKANGTGLLEDQQVLRDLRDERLKTAQLWEGMEIAEVRDKFVQDAEPIDEDEFYLPPNLPEFSDRYTLPKDFIWGLGTTAPQVEGAVKDEGRGPSIWDYVAHKVPKFIKSPQAFDIATNHYYTYKNDIDRMAALGVPYYSLSISWSRVFPLGNGTVNQKGLDHYIEEIDYLLFRGITPIVTLYHWDIPQALQNAYGGWLDPAVINDFTKYARVIFEKLAPKVKIWITLNEPQVFCNDYASWPDTNVPDVVFPTFGYSREERRYRCGHHAILAHAKVVELYRKEFQHIYGEAKFSFANSWDYTPPYTDHPDDVAASLRSLELSAGWFGNPIYIDGDYPPLMRELVGQYLPTFTEEEKALVLNSTDFYVWDSYSGHPVQAPEGGFNECYKDATDESWPGCFDEVFTLPGGWPIGNKADTGVSNWLYDTPTLFEEGVLWAWSHFRLSDFFVLEMGFSVWGESQMEIDQARYDQARCDYYAGYLNSVLRLVNEFGVNLSGVIAWSAWDNVEWREGMQTRFGVQYVNLETLKKTYKKSAFYLRQFFEYHMN